MQILWKGIKDWDLRVDSASTLVGGNSKRLWKSVL